MKNIPGREDVIEKVKGLIESELNIKIDGEDHDLVGTDTIDSYTMMLLISFVKKEFGVELNMEDMDFDAFGSLNTIADTILKAATA